jgi:hypothetical protein
MPAKLGVHAKGHVATDVGKRREIAVHDAVDIQPNNHLIRMPIHGRQDEGGLGHGVGLPHGAGLLVDVVGRFRTKSA